jgi:serine/threonine-protein kinase
LKEASPCSTAGQCCSGACITSRAEGTLGSWCGSDSEPRARRTPRSSSSGSSAGSADHYGAFAYSPKTDAFGWSNDKASRKEAEESAMAGCRKHASDCILPQWIRNTCGALAFSPKGYAAAAGETSGQAEKAALQKCAQHGSKCTVAHWICTTR